MSACSRRDDLQRVEKRHARANYLLIASIARCRKRQFPESPLVAKTGSDRIPGQSTYPDPDPGAHLQSFQPSVPGGVENGGGDRLDVVHIRSAIVGPNTMTCRQQPRGARPESRRYVCRYRPRERNQTELTVRERFRVTARKSGGTVSGGRSRAGSSSYRRGMAEGMTVDTRGTGLGEKEWRAQTTRTRSTAGDESTDFELSCRRKYRARWS